MEVSSIEKNNCAYENESSVRAQIFALISAATLGLFCFAGVSPGVAQAEDLRQNPAAGPAGSVIVQDKFGGQILGFDIDQASDEGVLSE